MKPLKIWAYLDNLDKNCQLVFQHFSFGTPLETMKKSCLLKWTQILRGFTKSLIKLIWKFHKSILKNAKTSQLSASIFEKVVPLYIISLIVHKGCHHFFLTPSSPMSSTSCSQFSDPHKKDVTISKFPLCNNQTGGEYPKIDKHTWWSNRTGQLIHNQTFRK